MIAPSSTTYFDIHGVFGCFFKILKADYRGLIFTQFCRYAQTGKQSPAFGQLDTVSAFHNTIRRTKIKTRSLVLTSHDQICDWKLTDMHICFEKYWNLRPTTVSCLVTAPTACHFAKLVFREC